MTGLSKRIAELETRSSGSTGLEHLTDAELQAGLLRLERQLDEQDPQWRQKLSKEDAALFARSRLLFEEERALEKIQDSWRKHRRPLRGTGPIVPATKTRFKKENGT